MHCYELSEPIDNFNNMIGLDNYLQAELRDVAGIKKNSVASEIFMCLHKAFNALYMRTSFEGGDNLLIYVFSIPPYKGASNAFTTALLIKQRNNGTCFIVSSIPLDFGVDESPIAEDEKC